MTNKPLIQPVLDSPVGRLTGSQKDILKRQRAARIHDLLCNKRPLSEQAAELLSQQQMVLGEDARFYADQRFKITAVFLGVTTALIAILDTDQTAESMSVALIGAITAGLCWRWDAVTREWWGRVFEASKEIEAQLFSADLAVLAYLTYPKWGRFRGATWVVHGLYLTALAAWVILIVWLAWGLL